MNKKRYPLIQNKYDDKDQLISTADYVSNVETNFIYDKDGNVIQSIGSDVSIKSSTDDNGNIDNNKYIIEELNCKQTYGYTHNDEGQLKKVTLSNGQIETLEYDKLSRVTEIDRGVEKEQINYYQKGDHATNLVSSVYHGGEKTSYRYDKKGNITEIYERGSLQVRYDYDALNRLIREDNVRLNKSYIMDYDNNGNIISKISSAFTLDNLTDSTEILYNYATTGNQDRLVGFDNKHFTYDDLGNPTLYRDKKMTWDYLRNLGSYNGIKFEYNASKIRTKKTLGNRETKYYWAENRLLAERRSLRESDIEISGYFYTGEDYFFSVSKMDIEYIYGAKGITGFITKKEKLDKEIEKKTYYYRRNILGDITHIFEKDSLGNTILKAKYIYDAWGNHEIVLDEDGIGSLNPFRHRGYYYDTETGLYYLRSRYYDPETGRFVNADDISYLDPESINGLNLYAYCGNNPVMRIDPNGNKWWNWVISGIQIVAGAALIATGVGAGFGAALIVSGSSMMLSNILDVIGVNSKLSMYIQSGLNIVAGTMLMFIPGMQSFGASMIGAGVLGIAGGHISEAFGGSFELGWSIGSIVGSIVGAGIYDATRISSGTSKAPMSGRANERYTQIKHNGKNVAFYNGRGQLIRRVDGSHTHFIKGFGHANPHTHIFNWHRYSGQWRWTQTIIQGIVRRG